MIAIPLDNEGSTEISKLYGNSAFFAFLDEETGSFKVVENPACGDGLNTAKFISSQNIDSTIFYYMGDKVYEYLIEKGLKVYSCLKTHLSIDAIYMQLSTCDCIEVTKENSSTLLDSGNGGCTCKAK
ncbi:[Fe-Mo] cluster-binding protein, NifX/NifB/NifY family [Arcobacter venerupis]|uniref:[Fe-Mo] cluster-binding protein, NifX/NifB/NifY family n=1 Tax=Arcobacter venerupis TaxID=1054033 RepID=A0AAE7B5F6_9BACT|nr:NifB/NifX family molybdenum-iron cluster-binding protein [Arcobacter venerupis]QKF65643.1 [Fe-Mo] cluster-binding protein, NifX/NifB/NifY family [Arcobacter venerupis]RWS50155.1 dinitrogenase iron-molybdenum cofactor biosynthesis protein [Arcobacter venerupis]